MKNQNFDSTTARSEAVKSDLDLCKEFFPALEWKEHHGSRGKVLIGTFSAGSIYCETNEFATELQIRLSNFHFGKSYFGLQAEETTAHFKETLQDARRYCDRLITALAKEV